MNLMIGVGGWAYFPSKPFLKLRMCAELYDFVEVNSTFYSIPSFESVKKWRESVPDSFEFTVRANRKLTHENHLRPTKESFDLFDSLALICQILRARILHFQFPAYYKVDRRILRDWRDFMNSLATRKMLGANRPLSFAFELRNQASSHSQDVLAFFEDFDIIPSRDASTEDELLLSSRSKLMYTRVFGGSIGEQEDGKKRNIDAEEMGEVIRRAERVHAAKGYIAFHNIGMYEDAFTMKEKLRMQKKTS